MRAWSFFKKILSSSWFLALGPAVIIAYLMPPLGSRYKLDIKLSKNNLLQEIHADLNSDTITESISLGKGLPFYYISVRDNNMRMYNEWSLQDSINPRISGIFTGNYDRDRYKEICIFTHKKDSLFLNMYEMLDPRGTRLDRIYIDRIGYLNDEVSSFVYPIGFYDEDGDGSEELYFSVTSSFKLGPRKIYLFDIRSRKLSEGPLTSIIPTVPEMTDADNDWHPEIFGFTSASGNYTSDSPYSDSSSWFMVFNEHLDFKFPPVEFKGFANSLLTDAFNGGYALLHWKGGADTSVMSSRIMIFAGDGKLIRYRLTSDLGLNWYQGQSVFRHPVSDRLFIFGNKIIELNGLLETVNSIKSPFNSRYYEYEIDIDNDKKTEIILYSEEEEKIVVYNEDLQVLVTQESRAPSPNWQVSHSFTDNQEHTLFIKAGKTRLFIKMTPNKYFYLGYLTYPALYVFFFLFILLIRKVNTLQIVHREHLKHRLVTLQLQGIKSQMDPHFTFNTLNSVASLVYMKDSQKAYDYMNKFTHLLRRSINDAERIYRHLGEEIDFVTTYLDLEKLRFEDKFNYEIKIGKGINLREDVPKLVLHTFAENAVKHGITSRQEGGFLLIMIERENDYLRLTIEDNGVGRALTAGINDSTGKGLKLTGEFYDILNEINKKPIRHIVTDLYDRSGAPAGTRVEVWVPVQLN